LGDSITQGQGAAASIASGFAVQPRWTALVAKARGTHEVNIGTPSQMVTQASGLSVAMHLFASDLSSRTQDTVFILGGTNDMNNRDGTSNGDAGISADYQTKPRHGHFFGAGNRCAGCRSRGAVQHGI
jgi:lysophospholipase L1-like esterase